MTLNKAGSSAGFNITLKREGGGEEAITTAGIHIWSPIQVPTDLLTDLSIYLSNSV